MAPFPPLSIENRVLLCNLHSQYASIRIAIQTFTAMKPNDAPPSVMQVSRLIKRFNQTGTVMNRTPIRQSPATSPEIRSSVLAAISLNPIVTSKELATGAGISKSSVRNILRKEKYHPYKVRFVHRLTEDDFFNRATFCEKFHDLCIQNPNLTSQICFTDESTFFLNGKMNHQNIRYYSDSKPHWMRDVKCQNAPKVNVWAGIYKNQVIGPFFIDGNINGDNYLNMLVNEAGPALAEAAGEEEVFWMQDGAPAHFRTDVREYLNQTFPGKWIGRQGPIDWPARSPDLTPMDFFLWGYIKHQVYLTQPESIDDLKARIIKACRDIQPEMFANCREGFFNRLHYCLSAEGKQFEHIIN